MTRSAAVTTAEHALHAALVRQVRPDMTASQALAAGAWVRPKGSIDPRVKKLVSAIRGA